MKREACIAREGEQAQSAVSLNGLGLRWLTTRIPQARCRKSKACADGEILCFPSNVRGSTLLPSSCYEGILSFPSNLTREFSPSLLMLHKNALPPF